MTKHLSLSVLSLLVIGLTACSQASDAGNPQPSSIVAVSPAQVKSPQPSAPVAVSPPRPTGISLSQLFSRVWRVTKAPSQPPSGSIYIFLPNGTLLQTSCGEPYRIATWTVDKSAPRVLRVVEDKQLAYTATIAQLTDTTLQLQKNLVRSNEKQAVTLTAVQQEFVCPDSRK